MIAFLDPEPAVAVLVGEGVAPLWQYLHDSPTQKLRRPGSLLRWMIELIRIRKECPAIGAGEWRILPTRSRHVLAVLYTRRDSTVLCLHNFDETPREITLDLKMPSGGERLRSLFGSGESHGSAGRHRLRLEPLGYDWYRVG